MNAYRIFSFSQRLGVALFVWLLAASTSALAFDPVSTSFFGGAIGGYDTTAYFTQGKPVRGDKAYRAKWKGAEWRFASAAARDRFLANPAASAPQFGGYCTNAMSMGKVVDGDPEIWRLHDGKLYLFYAESGREKFDADPAAMIDKATRNWERLSRPTH